MWTLQLFHVCLQSKVHQWHWLRWNMESSFAAVTFNPPLLHTVVTFGLPRPACSVATLHGTVCEGVCPRPLTVCWRTRAWPVWFVSVLHFVIGQTNCHFILPQSREEPAWRFGHPTSPVRFYFQECVGVEEQNSKDQLLGVLWERGRLFSGSKVLLASWHVLTVWQAAEEKQTDKRNKAFHQGNIL